MSCPTQEEVDLVLASMRNHRLMAVEVVMMIHYYVESCYFYDYVVDRWESFVFPSFVRCSYWHTRMALYFDCTVSTRYLRDSNYRFRKLPVDLMCLMKAFDYDKRIVVWSWPHMCVIGNDCVTLIRPLWNGTWN